jgi:hypothetical protein
MLFGERKILLKLRRETLMRIIASAGYIKIAGKKERGKRDGTGPFEGSRRRDRKGRGKGRGKGCPFDDSDKLNKSAQELLDDFPEESTAAPVPQDVQMMSPFDIAQALYWYCAEFHGGQWTNEYKVLSSLGYRPGAMERGIEPDNPDQERVYDGLISNDLDPMSLMNFVKTRHR